MRMRRKAWTEPLLDTCPFLFDNPSGRRGNWRHVFKNNDRPLWLEIGCGKGVSTVKMAHETPDINLIAIDEVRHVLAVTIKNAMDEYGTDSIDNLGLTTVDAMFIQDSFCADDGISRIIISFPNPWNEKAKQHKRRLTHPRQLMQYRSFLADGGEIHFKTDDPTLFKASKRYFCECGFTLKYETDDLHASGYSPNYVSEHEKLYTDRGMPIHFLIAVKGVLPEGYVYETEGREIGRSERGNAGQRHRLRAETGTEEES